MYYSRGKKETLQKRQKNIRKVSKYPPYIPKNQNFLASLDLFSPQKYQGEWEAEGVECQLVGEGEILHQPADKKILITTRSGQVIRLGWSPNVHCTPSDFFFRGEFALK